MGHILMKKYQVFIKFRCLNKNVVKYVTFSWGSYANTQWFSFQFDGLCWDGQKHLVFTGLQKKTWPHGADTYLQVCVQRWSLLYDTVFNPPVQIAQWALICVAFHQAIPFRRFTVTPLILTKQALYTSYSRRLTNYNWNTYARGCYLTRMISWS